MRRWLTFLLALALGLGLTSPCLAQYGYHGYPTGGAYPGQGWPTQQGYPPQAGYPGYSYSPTYQAWPVVLYPMPQQAAPAPRAEAPPPVVPKQRRLFGKEYLVSANGAVRPVAKPASSNPTSAVSSPVTPAVPEKVVKPQARPAPVTLPSIVEPPLLDKPDVTPKTVAPVEETHIVPPPATADDSGCHFFVLGGVSVLHADPSSREAFRVITNRSAGVIGQSASATTIESRNFDNTVVVSPQVWFGLASSDGLGVRGRYWYFHENDSQSIVNPDAAGRDMAVVSAQPGPFIIISSPSINAQGALPIGTGGGALALGDFPDFFTASHAMTLHVGDLEVFQAGQCGAWTLLGGVGLRYAHIRQAYDVLRTNAGGTTLGTSFLVDEETSEARHNFDGIGPTISGDVTRRLGDTGFGLYGLGRASLLIGQHRLSQLTTRTVQTDGFAGVVSSADSFTERRTVTDVLPVGELEVGAQYTQQVGGFDVLLRAGLQVQSWWNAGTPISQTGDLDFYGGSFLLGLLY